MVVVGRGVGAVGRGGWGEGAGGAGGNAGKGGLVGGVGQTQDITSSTNCLEEFGRRRWKVAVTIIIYFIYPSGKLKLSLTSYIKARPTIEFK